MFDTTITVIGNVLTAPEWRRTRNTNTLVLNFKVASTSRRFDRESGTWVDGSNLRVRVTCWRRLAENVAVSVMLGDPVVVHGRLFTRDWVDEEGVRHLAYELEADSVAHDLARGVTKFARRRVATSLDVVDGPEADEMVAGQPSEPVTAPEIADDVAACRSVLDGFASAVFDVGVPPLAPGDTSSATSAAAQAGTRAEGPVGEGSVAGTHSPVDTRAGTPGASLADAPFDAATDAATDVAAGVPAGSAAPRRSRPGGS